MTTPIHDEKPDARAVKLRAVVGRQPTLHEFLLRNIRAGVIDFSIRAEEQPGECVKFYIHPANESGDTLDFLLWRDPINDHDMLINEFEIRPLPSSEKLMAMLRARTANDKSSV